MNRVILFFLACGQVAISVAGAAGNEPALLGVHPYLPPAEIQKRFTPLANYLSTTVGKPVSVRVGRDYEDHIAAIGRNQIDIAFLGPSSYVEMTRRFGSKPLLGRLAVNGKPELTGVIIVRTDSTIRKLGDLKGKRFAYGDPQSTMSHIVPQGMLANAGVPDKLLARHQFLGAHKSVALAVLAGDFDAGAVKREVFDEYKERGLRALAISPPVSEHLLVTSNRVATKQVNALRRALLSLHSTTEGRAILGSIHREATAFVQVQDRDYNSLRQLMFRKGK